MENYKKTLAILAAAIMLLSGSNLALAGGKYKWSFSGGHGGYGHHNKYHDRNYHNGHHKYHDRHAHTRFRVCFYSRTHYRGHSYCESNYRTKNRVSHHWRHKIKSFKIYHYGVFGPRTPAVQVCNGYYGSGYCKTYYKGSPKLNDALYRHVYSYNIAQ